MYLKPGTRGHQGCACPRNLLLADGSSGAYGSVNRAGIYLGLTWSLLLIVLAAGDLIRSTPARRRLAAPVVAAGCTYLGLVAADFAHSLPRGYVSNDASTAACGWARRPRCASWRWPSSGPGCGPGASAPRWLGW